MVPRSLYTVLVLTACSMGKGKYRAASNIPSVNDWQRLGGCMNLAHRIPRL